MALNLAPLGAYVKKIIYVQVIYVKFKNSSELLQLISTLDVLLFLIL